MDVQILSIALGLLVSLIFAEMFGLTAGGMVVPGYLALFLHQPGNIALTFFAALATWGVVRMLSKVAIVYGKRRTLLMILFGFLIGAAIRTALAGSAAMADGSTAAEVVGLGQLAVIGYIIPGLLALWMDRQGCLETLSAVLTTTVVVRLVLILLAVEIVA